MSYNESAAAMRRAVILANAQGLKGGSQDPSAARDDADSLTGLPSARTLRRDLAFLIGALRQGQRISILSIDLADFGTLNRHYGRVVGDFVLREVALRLVAATRVTDFLCRSGGDRFMVVHPELPRPGESASLARRLLGVIGQPIACGSFAIELSASVGFTTADAHEENVDAVIARARESIDRIRRERAVVPAPAAKPKVA